MKLNAEVVERMSKKGNKYICIVIHITPDYEKVVYLDNAELELIKISTIQK